MGAVPIGWQDMAAWEGFTGISLDPWEARTIRRLSQAYVAQRQLSEKPDCPEPCVGRRDLLADKIRNVFKALAAQQAADKPTVPRIRRKSRNRKE